ARWAAGPAAAASRARAPARRHPPRGPACLVPEVTHAGEPHGGAARIGGLDDLLVARAAARLDDRRGTRLERLLESVREREEGVAPDDRAAERDAEPLGAGAGGADGLDARGLAAAEGEGAVGGGGGGG